MLPPPLPPLGDNVFAVQSQQRVVEDVGRANQKSQFRQCRRDGRIAADRGPLRLIF
jgi:hypothetical protein